MPYKEREIKKKYYSIGEVSDQLNLNTSLIRYWESEFEVLNPKKNKKGLRKYKDKDIETLKKIHSLLKNDGFTIEGAKKHFKSKVLNEENKIISELESIKKKLIELKTKI
ncbi:MAG: MerR family transcriptional regulator [Cytophagales bacterium]|jgi:DNA-binding transcriptional MerR regulator|nr:MerR family transcriptional regulator [Cytophagales bacterium]PDH40937.1 MAG: MerR family transcriptional regulator [Rhodothermaeota bacterium MED-G19]|tara:strand:- start:348 stop:677 length:330 start_codon:yes stop_codon:yes gene_type:complete